MVLTVVVRLVALSEVIIDTDKELGKLDKPLIVVSDETRLVDEGGRPIVVARLLDPVMETLVSPVTELLSRPDTVVRGSVSVAVCETATDVSDFGDVVNTVVVEKTVEVALSATVTV